MDYPDPATTPYGTHYELSTHLLANALAERGHTDLLWLRPALFVASINGHVYGWNQTKCSITSTVVEELTTRKDYARQLLRRAGVAVAAGGSWRPEEREQAVAHAERVGWPVVVKPARLSKGRGVTVGIADKNDFLTAWDAAAALTRGRIVIERQMDGDEARIVVVGGRAIAACGRRRPNVIGDGQSRIAELVAAKAAGRRGNPHLTDKPLELTAARAGYLSQAGLGAESVPAAGHRVWLEDRAGIAGAPSTWTYGADSVDWTDSVHPSYLREAERAALAFGDPGVLGVDMIAQDWQQPAAVGSHIVVEVNCRPAIGCHHFPWEGPARDVAGAIIDACLDAEPGDDAGTDGDDPDGWMAELPVG
jgi:cyanophycin synthetase